MKKTLLLTLSLCCAFNVWAQLPVSLSAQLPENISHGSYRISDQYTDQTSGITHIYLQQHINGIDILEAVAGLHLNQEEELIYHTSSFFKHFSKKENPTNTAISPETAFTTALSDATPNTLRTKSDISLKEKKSPYSFTYTAGDLLSMEAPVKLVFKQNGQKLQLCWQVSCYPKDQQHYWTYLLDANTGRILSKTDQIIRCTFHPERGAHTHHAPSHEHSPCFLPEKEQLFGRAAVATGNYYRVFDRPTETPAHGNRSLIQTNGDPLASPLGWHNDGLLPYTVTRGNNVFAYADQLGLNLGLPSVGGLLPAGPLNFDYPLDLSQEPGAYTNAAVTNLFYWNNLCHDIFYHYGFTEEAGNFQQDNFFRGGLGLDGVMAEAQDGSGTNNANFLTLPDGLPGRMQMYLWASNEATELVHLDNSATYPTGGPSFLALEAAFGPAPSDSPITAELVPVVANAIAAVGSPSEGCGTDAGIGLPPSNDVLGRIVLIDRGSCSFIEKVQGAQEGGALGVIVVNNQPNAELTSMGGDETGATIVIPSVMISYEDGQLLKQELNNGTVTVTFRRDSAPNPMKDGDLDNGIIVHEYGHGVSTRLTGGPSQTCLTGDEQAGEGWSDFFALMLTMTDAELADRGFQGRGIGTYVMAQGNEGTGIRPARYARDMSVNPYTYSDINNPEISVPHGVGFIFATALYEMAWNLIDLYGFDEDVYKGQGGNNIALQLVMEGLKLQACAPTFLDSRDAILTADQLLYDGAHQCLIWEAFAKRGMGASAQAGTNSRGDETEAFDLPGSCAVALNFTKSTDTETLLQGQTLTYTLTLKNTGTTPIHKISVADPLPEGVQYINQSASDRGKKKRNSIVFPALDLAAGQEKELSFQVQVQTPTATDLYFFDDAEDGLNRFSTNPGLQVWSITDTDAFSGDHAWFASNPNNLSNQTLTLATPVTIPENGLLTFKHRFDTEESLDGGVVEISTDNGLSWTDLGSQFIQNGYNAQVLAIDNPLIGGFAFSGNSHGWIESIVNLSVFSGQQVLIRFRFASDFLVPAQGWWIDDILIGTDPTFITNTANYYTANGYFGTATITNMVVKTLPQLQQHIVIADKDKDTPDLTVFPNPVSDQLNVRWREDLNTPVQLLNANGQLLQTEPLNQGQATFRVEGLPSGMYLIKAFDGRQYQTKTIVVN